MQIVLQFVVTKGFKEAEDIKQQYRNKASTPTTPPAQIPKRPQDGVQIGLSNLPEIDWGDYAPEPSATTSTPVIDASFFDDLGRPSAPPAPSTTTTSSSSSSQALQLTGAATAAGGSYNTATPGAVGEYTLTNYSSSFSVPSSSSLQKHSLFVTRTASGSQNSSAVIISSASARSRYPEFDSHPVHSSVLDELWQSRDKAAAAGQPLDGAMGSLVLSEQQQAAAALAVAMQPSAGPSPAPQEMEVSRSSSNAHQSSVE